MTESVRNGGQRSRRKPPSPRSILDQAALVSCLDDRGLLNVVTRTQIQGFYQSLHRQHYPTLQQFVETYHFHATNNTGSASVQAKASVPLQSHVSSRKNYNRVQLPKVFLEFLSDKNNGFVAITSRVASKSTSRDGSTTKLVVELADGQCVESVLMRYTGKGKKGLRRASLCVSSQVGCAMGCTFCATGTMGLLGNLTCGEILEQIVHANRILAEECDTTTRSNKENNNQYLVRNVVFMGMGEPLDNYTQVVEACRALIDHKRWNLAHGRVTVSTVGLVPKIRKLTAELPEVSLALSLHAPFQEMRAKIVPSAKHYSLESLIEALDDHRMAYERMRRPLREHSRKPDPKRRAMIEYVMLEGPTSTLECAHELGRLCQNRNLTVNLIPYNPTDVKDQLRCPSEEHIQEFRGIVASYGSFCTIRRTMGADIASACGQLVRQERMEGLSEQRDMEDYAVVRSPAVRPMPRAITPSSSKTVPADTTEDLDLILPSPANEHNVTIIRYLTWATSLAASCFVISSLLYLRQRRR